MGGIAFPFHPAHGSSNLLVDVARVGSKDAAAIEIVSATCTCDILESLVRKIRNWARLLLRAYILLVQTTEFHKILSADAVIVPGSRNGFNFSGNPSTFSNTLG